MKVVKTLIISILFLTFSFTKLSALYIQKDSLKQELDYRPAYQQEQRDSLPPTIDELSAKLKKEIEEIKQRKYSPELLDTIDLRRDFIINDYSMIGVEYATGIHRMIFLPRRRATSVYSPVNIGILFTSYSKMFGFMPYFGLQIAFYYNHQGYKMKFNKETKKQEVFEGTTQENYTTLEIPILSQIHYDFPFFKIFVSGGFFGAYRTAVFRQGPNLKEERITTFSKTDRRWDYGLRGGGGFALVYSPFELQFTGGLRYSWGTLFEPDYRSKDFYRYANPLDIYIGVGLHLHLSKRVGKTKSMIRKEVRDILIPKVVEKVAKKTSLR